MTTSGHRPWKLYGELSEKPFNAHLTPAAHDLVDHYGLSGTGHLRSRIERLVRFFALRADGQSPLDAAQELGLSREVARRYENYVLDWHRFKEGS